MTTIAFDTLKYAKRLKEAGFTESQAEAQTQALAEALEDAYKARTAKAATLYEAVVRPDARLPEELMGPLTGDPFLAEKDSGRDLATKADLRELEIKLKAEIAVLDARLRMIERVLWGIVLGVIALLIPAYVLP